jgi:hypothetical protein
MGGDWYEISLAYHIGFCAISPAADSLPANAAHRDTYF